MSVSIVEPVVVKPEAVSKCIKKFGMLPEMIKGRHPARDAMNQLAATTKKPVPRP